jgi:tetratricopeptide (TPR) repeat protein
MKGIPANFYLKICFMMALMAPVVGAAQSARAYEKAGDKAFAEKDYYTAFVHFQDAMTLKPEEIRLWFKYAEVARQFNAFETAADYYGQVAESEEAPTLPLAAFWMGQMRKSLGNYNGAIAAFQQYLSLGDTSGYYARWAKQELETCRWASDAQPPGGVNTTIEHPGKKINSPYSEFGAVEQGSTLYYSSYRYQYKDDSREPERKLAKVLSSEKMAKGRTLPRGFNAAGKHTANTAFSADGSRIYFTLCDFVTSSDIRCDIYYREKDRRGRWEKKARKLEDFINKSGSTTTQPAIGFDSIEQKEVLYFVSDRPGGKGKLDLWYAFLEKDKFSEPANLEAINTPENDITPFFDSGSQMLYFSSEGHPGFGGYDIFKIEKGSEWGPVVNLGKPVNTSYHEIYYSPGSNESTAFLSSNRPGAYYLDPLNKACCYDIFKVIYEPVVQDTSEIPPVVTTEPPPPAEPTTLKDFLPLALYFGNDEPDKRTLRTTTKKSYEATYSKFIARKQEYQERYTKPLDEDEASDAALALEDFFESEVRRGYEHLNLFSQILLKRLEKGERVEIVIKGYTSPRAKSDYNDNLAKRRISSLRNHFDTYNSGVFEAYLKEGKLVISEAPFGETKADTTISDDLLDERNSIYSVGASKERRVEIVEVK